MKKLIAVLLAATAALAGSNTIVAPKQSTDVPLHTNGVMTAANAVTIPQMLSYQGKLTDTLGVPLADTTYSVAFRLYTQPTGGSALWSETQNVATRDGLFAVLLGSVTPIGSVPDAGVLYLGMSIAGGAELAPRLRIASAAYAYKADTANYALAGGEAAWVRGGDSVLYTAHKLGIARGGAENKLWGDSAQTHINLGVACTTGLSGQAYRYATVSGGQSNVASRGWSTVCGGYGNFANGSHALVGGGEVNRASGQYSVLVGGYWNGSHADYSTVGGGAYNGAGGLYASVLGGYSNHADSGLSFIGGGNGNYATGRCAAVGAGSANLASGEGSVVPGGAWNAASGTNSMAAGTYARAGHYGSFVWGDSTSTSGSDSVYTTGSNQFRVRARGGTWFFSNAGMTTGAYLAPNSNSWESACDSTTKEDFLPVDKQALLDRVAALRVRNYKMKDQNDGTRHIGPVAQDFHNAFGYGGTETGINLADADGVLLAAVQALYEQNKAQQAEIEALRAKLSGR